MKFTKEQEEELAEIISGFEYDPVGFVMYAYPWGVPGGPLERVTGPRAWQLEALERIGRQFRAKRDNPSRVINEACTSGHGIGKSALLGMVTGWGMSTKEDTRGIITAGTEGQLKTKTWPEISKWFRMMINAHWFTIEDTSIYSAQRGKKRDWRFDRVTWNRTRTESFAGLHNEGKRLIVLFDEASQIDDKIWEVTDGALTDSDTDIFFGAYGNPTRNTGEFRRCFGVGKARWSEGAPMQIDSRTVEGVNKQYLQTLVDEYGENSDRVRVRVRGLFPTASTLQFIDSDLVSQARAASAENKASTSDALIMALDVARGGDDDCVFRFRRALDARTIPPVRIPGTEAKQDNNRIINVCLELIRTHRPDALFVDGTGVGGYLVNWLRSSLGSNSQTQIIEVQFGSASPDTKCNNMRTYMWSRMKEWLQLGGVIDDSPVLEQDLVGVEYDHDPADKLRLEKKEHMKLRGLPSPDHGDALAMTFARHVEKAGFYDALDGDDEKYDPLAILKRAKAGHE